MTATADIDPVPQIVAILREHIKVDATGLSPAVIGHYVIGFEEAARAIRALIDKEPG